MNRLLRLMPLAAALFVLLPSSTDTNACGPVFQIAVSRTARRPDFPLRRFAEGHLGVLSSRYARSYLVVSFRHMQGLPMSPGDAASLEQLWLRRLEIVPSGEAVATKAAQAWLEARRRVPGVPEKKSFDVYGEERRPWPALNVYADALTTARTTLEQRARTWGRSSPHLRAWVLAQDAVFAGRPDAVAALAPAPGAPAPAAADHRYQFAAATFYGGDAMAAADLFAAIANDATSPWRPWARYLQARAMIRADVLEEALVVLRQAAEDPAASPAARVSAFDLARHVRFRLDAPGLDKALAEEMLVATPPSALGGVLDDLTWTLDRRTTAGPSVAPALWPDAPAAPRLPGDEPLVREGSTAPPPDFFAGNRALAQVHELYDWVLTFEDGSQGATDHAWERWRTTHSRAWLVAALALSRHDAVGRIAPLLAAAEQVPSTAAEFETVAYHRARLLLLAGRDAEARHVLDEALMAQPTPSGANLLRDLRRQTATDIASYARDLASVPAGITDNIDPGERAWATELGYCEYRPESCRRATALAQQPFIGSASAAELDRLPLATLAHVATSPGLPGTLRVNLVSAALTRALALGDDAILQKMAAAGAPLDGGMRADLEAVVSAADAERRRFAAALFVLRRPGLSPYVRAGLPRALAVERIDDYRDNWWCSAETDWFGRGNRGAPTPWMAMGLPRYPSQPLRAEGARQFDRLFTSGGAGNVLGRIVLAYARAHPEDASVPEALHRVVRVTRYGCESDYSQRAFSALHARYADSEWAKKTPHWF